MDTVYAKTTTTPETQKLLDEFKKLSEEKPDEYEVDDNILNELQVLCDLFEKYNSYDKLKKHCVGVPPSILKGIAYGCDYVMRDTRFSQLEPYLLLKGDSKFYKKVAPNLLERIPFVEQKISKNPKCLEMLKISYKRLQQQGGIQDRDAEFVNSIRPSNR